MSNAAHIIVRQNEIMRKFRHAGATDPAKARPLSELTVKPDRVFRKMQDQGIVRPGRSPEAFYIDLNAAEEFVAARRRRAYYMMLLILLVAALVFFLGRR